MKVKEEHIEGVSSWKSIIEKNAIRENRKMTVGEYMRADNGREYEI